MQSPERVHIDKWLWAVRLYKSRSLAAEACHAGHVRLAGQRVKPSREIHRGEVITAFADRVHGTVKVLGLLEQRVGPKLVEQFLQDQTSPEEYARAREEAAQALIQKGALSCGDCHAVGKQPALSGADTATVDFAHIPERLRKDYYDFYANGITSGPALRSLVWDCRSRRAYRKPTADPGSEG